MRMETIKEEPKPPDEETERKDRATQKDQAEKFMSDYGQESSDLRRLLDPRRVLVILEYKRRILDFVESMLEDDIDLEKLQSGENLICQRDYDSIVQERYISRLCGFPLCPKHITQEWKQKYHISYSTKTIYDVEIRKLYCTIKCMNKSIQYRNANLNSEPVWMKLDNFKLEPNFGTRKSNP